MKKTGFFSTALIFLAVFSPLLKAASDVSLNIPKLSQAPKIDGMLDNQIWEQQALKVEGFRQFTPKEKSPPSERTIAYLGYDQKNLYIAFRCFDSEPDKLRATITNRDGIMDEDWVIIFLDTFYEKRRAFSFILNPLGIQMDMIRVEEGGSDRMDASWDTVFYSDGKIDEQGYTVEIAVPFKSVRFPDSENNLWGLTLGRSIARSGEIITWPEMTRDQPGLLCQAGELLIADKVERGRNFEMMPVFTSLKTEGESIDAQPGLNFKWGVSSDLTVDMTVNPDFSQIEADAPQIDVNQRFALYFPEKRPFFLEGMEIFQFPEIQMVYTRRIIDPIVGAKLTGKTGGMTYGFLSALDTSPAHSLWKVSDGEDSRNRNALFNIFRLKVDVLKESYVGFSMTDKEVDGAYNRVAGIDGQFKFKRNFFFSFQALASKTKLDSSPSDVSPALFGSFGYFSKYIGGSLFWISIHPEFEASSGFVNRVDYRTFGGFTYASLYPQKSYLEEIQFSISGGRRFTYDLDFLEDEWVETGIRFRINQFSQIEIEYRRDMERYEGVDFPKQSFEIGGELNLIGWLPLGFVFNTGDSIFYDPDDPFLGYSNIYALFFTLKPNKRLRMTTSFSKQTFWEQWGGEQVYDFNVVRQRITYQISKSLSLRTIIDYNHYYKEIYGSFLISYILKPGTVFFLGIDNNYLEDNLGRFARTDYSIFLKFSYWHRI